MGNSLQDQMLKAGLANRKQAVRAKKAKNNKEKLQRHGIDTVDESAELVRTAERDKLARDRELNRKKTEQAELKAIQAQIRQLISLNRIAERGDIEFRFTDGKLVKTLMIQEAQRLALVAGRLAIVKASDQCDLVPREVAKKIAERDPDKLLLCNDSSGTDEVDDEYSSYQVPDDLMW